MVGGETYCNGVVHITVAVGLANNGPSSFVMALMDEPTRGFGDERQYGQAKDGKYTLEQ